MVEFRVLGPVEIVVDGRALEIPALKRRVLLADLILNVNRPVTLTQLLRRIWDVRPPPTAEAAIRNHVSGLRKLLHAIPDVALVTVGGGYELRADAGAVDSGQFLMLAKQGRRKVAAGHPADGAEQLRQALALWRGPVLADLVQAGFVWPQLDALNEHRMVALEDRIEAELHLGQHRRLTAELERLTREHPGRERLYRQHMVALYRSGRQAHALEVYRHAREVLPASGVQAGVDLQELYLAILDQRTADVGPPLRTPYDTAVAVTVDGTGPAVVRQVAELRRVAVLGLRIRCSGVSPCESNVAQGMRTVLAAVDRYGGRIEQIIGPTVLVSYGIPVAHADDCERAVRTALSVRSAGEPQWTVAAAVTTGTVFVAQDENAAPSIVGGVIGECRNAADEAPLGAVHVSAAVHRATSHIVRYARPTHPDDVWAAVSAMDGDGMLPSRAEAGLVGRNIELRFLREVLTSIRDGHRAYLVRLVGPAGIGKTALLAELLGGSDARRLQQVWVRRTASSAGDGDFRVLLPKPSPGEPDTGLADLQAALQSVLDELTMEGSTRRSLERAAQRLRPRVNDVTAAGSVLVIAFDDVEPGETAAQLADHVAASCEGQPLMVALTSRTDVTRRRLTSDQAVARNVVNLAVPPLTRSNTITLLNRLLGRTVGGSDDLSSVLPAALHPAGPDLLLGISGNPLFAAEYARMVLDGGSHASVEQSPVPALPIPDNVHAVVAARVDGLGDAARAVLRAASVVGTVFWLDAVVAVTGLDAADAAAGVAELVDHEVVKGILPAPDYAFCQLQTRDVVYGRIPRGMRRVLHERVARWVETNLSEDWAPVAARHRRVAAV